MPVAKVGTNTTFFPVRIVSYYFHPTTFITVITYIDMMKAPLYRCRKNLHRELISRHSFRLHLSNGNFQRERVITVADIVTFTQPKCQKLDVSSYSTVYECVCLSIARIPIRFRASFYRLSVSASDS